MKTLLTLLMAVLIVSPAFTQEDTGSVKKTDDINLIMNDDETNVTSESEAKESDQTNQDTTRLKIGKKGIEIIEGEKGTQLNIEDIDENKEYDEDFDWESEDEDDDHSKFKAHWAGFEVGLNNYVNSSRSMSLDNSMSYMDLNTGRSWNFNINFMDYGFRLISDKIGLVTGLGFEWNNYHFDNNNNITKVNGVIESLPLTYTDIKKNKLQSTYLRAPLLMEFQIPAGKKRIYFSAGPMLGVKLGSSTKIVYKENGDEQKVKDKDDYNLSAIRYGVTARAGYAGLNIFANYYITPLFESGKGPELYPFSIGLTLIDF
jgi:hypothetical protein